MTSSVIIREYKYLLSYSFIYIYIYIQFISRCSLPSPPQESLIHHPNLPSPTSPLSFPTPFIYLFITSPQPSIHFIHPIIPTLPNSSHHQPSIQVTISNISNPPSLPHSRVPQLSSMQIYKSNSHYTHIHTYTQAHKHTSTTKPIIHYPSLIIHISHLPPHNIFPQSPKDLLIPTPISSLSPIPFITSLTTHTSLNSLFPLTFPSSLSQSPILNPQSSISNPQSPFHTNPPIPLVHQSISPLHSFTPPHSTPLQHSKTPPFKKSIQSNLVQPSPSSIIHPSPFTHHPCTPERNKKEIHLSIYPPIYPFLLAQANKTKHNITYFASISISISI